MTTIDDFHGVLYSSTERRGRDKTLGHISIFDDDELCILLSREVSQEKCSDHRPCAIDLHPEESLRSQVTTCRGLSGRDRSHVDRKPSQNQFVNLYRGLVQGTAIGTEVSSLVEGGFHLSFL
jgi:hypothetical protein